MDKNKQRIAIAEACGWIWDHSRQAWWRQGQWCVKAPKFLTDLNAMHEAEKVLRYAEWEFYRGALFDVVCKRADIRQQAVNRVTPDNWAIHATAAQRAEAFLRAVSKWEDSAVVMSSTNPSERAT